MHRSHGMCGTRTYRIWGNMLNRCSNDKKDGYEYYGGKGIDVCERWKKFDNFLEDMGVCPEGYSIERKNSNLNYELENCYWADKITQANNKCNTIYIEYNGENKSMAEWSRFLGISRATIWLRYNKGKQIKDVLSPTKTQYRNAKAYKHLAY